MHLASSFPEKMPTKQTIKKQGPSFEFTSPGRERGEELTKRFLPPKIYTTQIQGVSHYLA